jgi:hypothetical protein
VPSTFLGGTRAPELIGKEGQGGVMMGMIGIMYCDSDKEDLHCDYGYDHVKMLPEVAQAGNGQKSYKLEQVHWQ